MDTITPTLEQDAVEEDSKVVLEKEEEAANEDGYSRDSIMEGIMHNRNEALKAEIALDAVEVPEQLEEVPSEIEVKVNGETRKVSATDIEEYQKGVAADEKFRDVAAKKEDLKKRETAFAERERAFKLQREQVEHDATIKVEPKVESVVEKKKEAAFSDDDADALITAIFAEDREGVTKAIKKIQVPKETVTVMPAPAAAPAPTITPADIDSAIDQREKRKELSKAVARFGKEYPSLKKNFSAEVDAQTIVEQQKNPEASFWEIIQGAAEHVKQKAAEVVGTTSPPEKKTVPVNTQVRSTVTRRFTAPPKKGEGKTPFEEIRASRGQG